MQQPDKFICCSACDLPLHPDDVVYLTPGGYQLPNGLRAQGLPYCEDCANIASE